MLRSARATATGPRLAAASLLTAALVLPVAAPALAAPPVRDPGPAIEVLSPYQGQRICDPVVRPGVAAFRRLVLAAYPGTGDSGVVRECAIGGTSEHKEGRAWDWRVSASDPAQVAQVQDMLTWLLAPDARGEQAAMARRLGVMYVIWNRKIWMSHQAVRGWQPYTGSNPHTDHVHISFSWAGAYQATSYWTGTVAPVMAGPLAPTPTGGPTAFPTPPATATTTRFPDRRSWLQSRDAALSRFRGPWRRH